MRIYVALKDIKGASLGSGTCPIARALTRKFPPRPGQNWGVGITVATLWDIGERTSVRRFNLGAAARRLVSNFDAGYKVKPRHIALEEVAC